MPGIMDWLRLINGGQTPQENPAFGFRATNDPYGPNAILDSQGALVTDPDRLKAYQSAVKGGYVDRPYKPITGISATFNPEAANFAAQQNAQYGLAPALASRQREITRGLTAADLATLPRPYLPNPDLDTAANVTLSGGNTSARGLLGEQGASADILQGLPAARARLESNQNVAAIQEAKNRLAIAQGVGGRLPTTEATLDSDAVNALSKSLNVDPMSIRLSAARLRGELGRDPSYQELQDEMLHLQRTDVKTNQAIADTRASLIPQLQQETSNRIISSLLESGRVPIANAPYSSVINKDNTISPPMQDPRWMGTLEQMMARLGNPSLAPGFKIPLRSIDPMTGLPTSENRTPTEPTRPAGTEIQHIVPKSGTRPTVSGPIEQEDYGRGMLGGLSDIARPALHGVARGGKVFSDWLRNLNTPDSYVVENGVKYPVYNGVVDRRNPVK